MKGIHPAGAGERRRRRSFAEVFEASEPIPKVVRIGLLFQASVSAAPGCLLKVWVLRAHEERRRDSIIDVVRDAGCLREMIVSS